MGYENVLCTPWRFKFRSSDFISPIYSWAEYYIETALHQLCLTQESEISCGAARRVSEIVTGASNGIETRCRVRG